MQPKHAKNKTLNSKKVSGFGKPPTILLPPIVSQSVDLKNPMSMSNSQADLETTLSKLRQSKPSISNILNN
jgi:hypothetical protein